MKKALFIDRDGTIIREPKDFQVDSFEKLRFMPGAITNLARIAADLDYELVMVTNQDGLGTASFPTERFQPVHDFMMSVLDDEGVHFSDVLIDRSFAHENLPSRKPNTGMLGSYLSGGYDLANSYVIGDRPTDVELAANLGAQAIFIRSQHFEVPRDEGRPLIEASSWAEIYELLKRPHRRAMIERKTSETNISVELDLDGQGKARIDTGLAFFDHMLEQVARHASFDLSIKASGDLHIDEHHTIEDVGIVLGEAFSNALQDKRGMERYGFVLPMDDSLAQVAIDFGGRSWVVWDAEFRREMIGKMPTEMFFHFFKSFSDKAGCNLNIKAEGTNEHHKIEAIFKAFARAVKMAVRRDKLHESVPSTKGVV